MVDDASVQALMEITQCSSERAHALLEAAGNSLDTAVTLHFDDASHAGTQPTQPPAQAQARPAHAPAAGPQARHIPMSLMEELNQDLVRTTAPRQGPRPTMWEASPGSLLMMALFPVKLVRRVVQWMLWLVGLHTREPTNTRQRFDAKLNSSRYRQAIERNYSPAPFLFQGGYLEALNRANSELKNLVVVLTSDIHEDTPRFIKHVLLGERFQTDIADRDDVIIWGGSVQVSEAFLLAGELQMTSLPLVALIAPSPKTPQSSTIVMAALERFQGSKYIDANGGRLASAIEAAIEDHAPKIMALRLERQRQSSDREIRAEQDSAYERSLAADRQRAAERRATEEQALAAELAQNRQKLEQAALRQSLTAKFAANEPVQADGATRILIRMPDGHRVVRWFSGSDPISTIYDYILTTIPQSEEEEEADLDPAAQISLDGVLPVYNFELMSPILRRPVPPDRDTPIADEPALWPNGSVVVDFE